MTYKIFTLSVLGLAAIGLTSTAHAAASNPFTAIASVKSTVTKAQTTIGQVGSVAGAVKTLTSGGATKAINTSVMTAVNTATGNFTSTTGVITVNPGGTTGGTALNLNLGGLTGGLAANGLSGVGNEVASSLGGSSSGSSAIRAGFVKNFAEAGKLGSAPQTQIATGGPWGGKLFTVSTSGGGLFGGLLGGLNLGGLSLGQIGSILANPTGALAGIATNVANNAINGVVSQATGALNNAVGGALGQVSGVLNTANQIGGIASSISSGNIAGVAQQYAGQALAQSGVGQTINQIGSTVGQVQTVATTVGSTVGQAQNAFATYQALQQAQQAQETVNSVQQIIAQQQQI